MALTQVAISSRKAIRYTIFFIIFLTVGKILLTAGIGIYKTMFPSPPPPPTVKYGRLTKIPFPKLEISPKLNYILETPDGSFPKVPSQLNVYLMPKASANLLALDIAKDKAKNMGFSPNAQAESDTVYKFDRENYPSNLRINIITGNFSISYDLASDQSPLNTKPPISEVAANEYRSILSGANTLPTDLTGPVTHEFFKLNNGQLIPSISLSESDLTKVNLFRKSYNELPAVTEKPNQSNIWAIISGSRNREQQIIASEYHYYPIDESEYSTYPIKSPETAFSELQSGSAYFASLGTVKEGDNLKIRKVYLAYYDPSVESDFYQPVYVFEGDNNYSAYVPAITSDYYGK